MSACQDVFQPVAHFIAFALALIDIIAKGLLALPVANLASAVHFCQGAADMVVRVFYAAFADVRHVAISAGHSPLGMDTHLAQFKIRMLCFQNRRTAQSMDIVMILIGIVVLLSSLDSKPFIPRKGQIGSFPSKVVLQCHARKPESASPAK